MSMLRESRSQFHFAAVPERCTRATNPRAARPEWEGTTAAASISTRCTGPVPGPAGAADSVPSSDSPSPSESGSLPLARCARACCSSASKAASASRAASNASPIVGLMWYRPRINGIFPPRPSLRISRHSGSHDSFPATSHSSLATAFFADSNSNIRLICCQDRRRSGAVTRAPPSPNRRPIDPRAEVPGPEGGASRPGRGTGWVMRGGSAQLVGISAGIGGTPAIPRIEFSSARFSARSRATSSSSARL